MLVERDHLQRASRWNTEQKRAAVANRHRREGARSGGLIFDDGPRRRLSALRGAESHEREARCLVTLRADRDRISTPEGSRLTYSKYSVRNLADQLFVPPVRPHPES